MTKFNKQPVSDIGPIATGLKKNDQSQLEDHLTNALADTMLLMMKTQTAHWNAIGAISISLHKLTEEQYKDLFQAADVIAERIRALGFTAPLSYRDMLHNTIITEEVDILTPYEMIQRLVADHEKIVRRMREIARIADQMEDYVTQDLIVSRMAFHEKAIWQLRATITDPVTLENPLKSVSSH